jgi:hypothetical protein
VTQQDVRRIIYEYMAAHPPSESQEDELDEYALKRGFDPGVWDDVIGNAARSGEMFFTLLVAKRAEEELGDEEGMVEVTDMPEMVAQVCGAVAATFFMLGFEVARETG